MIKKIAAFMMGVGLLTTSSLAMVSANAGGSFGTNTATPTVQWGFGMHAANTQGIGIAGAWQDQGSNLINIIKNAINWILSILGLITLVLLLWGGFNMVTAAGDDKKFGMWQTILKHAAIGLLFIALSLFMVNFIFWVIGAIGAGANTTGV